MGDQTRNQSSNVNSHIQMPKLLLKRFHNEKNQFYYYDVVHGFIGTRGTAESTNTELGYYSLPTEHFLRDNIETPFGRILAYIDKVDFDQESFCMASDFEQVARNFIYALMARDPVMLKEMNARSIFSQFLPAQSCHDFAATTGIAIARQNQMFAEYLLTFLVNRTEVPFVLPMEGLYAYRLNDHSIINLPISPRIALCLVHNSYADRLIHDDGTVSMFIVNFPDMVMKMNLWAFNSQKQRNWGSVICPQRDELDRLVKESG